MGETHTRPHPAATSFLADVGVVVLSTPVVETIIVAAVVPPGPPPAGSVGAIIGGVVGGIVAALFIVGTYVAKMRRRAKVHFSA